MYVKELYYMHPTCERACNAGYNSLNYNQKRFIRLAPGYFAAKVTKVVFKANLRACTQNKNMHVVTKAAIML